jgi:hypothetical protein
LSEVSQAQKAKYCIFIHVQNAGVKSYKSQNTGTGCKRDTVVGGSMGEDVKGVPGEEDHSMLLTYI